MEEQKTALYWYEEGNRLRQAGDFGGAINAYKKSCEIDPESPAATVITILNDILAYRNTDLINP